MKMNIHIDRRLMDKEKDMFNVTVLKMKDIKKYFIGMVATVLVIIVASKYIPQTNKEKKEISNLLPQNAMLGCLEESVPASSIMEEEEEENQAWKEENLLQGVLRTQISSIEKIEENKKENVNTQEDPEETKETLEKAQTGVTTKVITNNPLKESYNTQIRKYKNQK